jgi:hypothetical protein
VWPIYREFFETDRYGNGSEGANSDIQHRRRRKKSQELI